MVNPETVIWRKIAASYWEARLKDLVEEHLARTGSARAAEILARWEENLPHFWQVVPREMLSRLPQPLDDAEIKAVAAE